MNPEIKAQWVAALRSGEYKQGTGVLRETDESGETTYCCLGVLCELAVKAWVIPKPTPLAGEYVRRAYDYGIPHTREDIGEITSYVLPPNSVVQWADLGTPNPYVSSQSPLQVSDRTLPRKSLGLTDANDSGFSFQDIADLIERYM